MGMGVGEHEMYRLKHVCAHRVLCMRYEMNEGSLRRSPNAVQDRQEARLECVFEHRVELCGPPAVIRTLLLCSSCDSEEHTEPGCGAVTALFADPPTAVPGVTVVRFEFPPLHKLLFVLATRWEARSPLLKFCYYLVSLARPLLRPLVAR